MAGKKPSGQDARFFDLYNRINAEAFKFVNPVNLQAEREKFFEELEKGNEYNPSFAYASKNPFYSYFYLNPELSNIVKELREMDFEDSAMELMIDRKRNLILKEIRLIESISSSGFSEKSLELYGQPSKETVRHALELAGAKAEPSLKNVSSEKLAGFFRKKLSEQKIDLNVELTDRSTSKIIIFPSDKTMQVRENSFFSKNDLKRLYLHEVETHYYRYLNALSQPYRVFLVGSNEKWLSAEEGLAVFNEFLFGFLRKEKLREYAGRVLAVHHSLDHSFFETFDFLRQYFDEKSSFELTARAKRGLKDSVQKGGLTKDYYYLQGFNEVKDFVREIREPELLYYGKISIRDARDIDKIPGLKKPRLLPDYKKVRSKIKSL